MQTVSQDGEKRLQNLVPSSVKASQHHHFNTTQTASTKYSIPPSVLEPTPKAVKSYMLPQISASWVYSPWNERKWTHSPHSSLLTSIHTVANWTTPQPFQQCTNYYRQQQFQAGYLQLPGLETTVSTKCWWDSCLVWELSWQQAEKEQAHWGSTSFQQPQELLKGGKTAMQFYRLEFCLRTARPKRSKVTLNSSQLLGKVCHY